MSWLRRIFSHFKNESEEVEEEVKPSKQENVNNSIVKKQRWETHTDEDSKVLYQYPKGNFRFPLVPDEPKKTRNQESVHKEESDRIPELTSRRSLRKRESHLVQQATFESNQLKKTDKRANTYSTQEASEGDKRRTRPFKPADIPSPIYGFSKRPVEESKTDHVEYELTSFEHRRSNGGHKESFTKTLQTTKTVQSEETSVLEVEEKRIEEKLIKSDKERSSLYVEEKSLPAENGLKEESILELKGKNRVVNLADSTIEAPSMPEEKDLQLEEDVQNAEEVVLEVKEQEAVVDLAASTIEAPSMPEEKDLQFEEDVQNTEEVTIETEEQEPSENIVDSTIEDTTLKVLPTGNDQQEAVYNEDTTNLARAEENLPIVEDIQLKRETPIEIIAEKDETDSYGVPKYNMLGEVEEVSLYKELEEIEADEGESQHVLAQQDIQSETEGADPVASPSPSTEKKEGKSIPFNVIMLKKDRQFLMEKKQPIKAPQHETSTLSAVATKDEEENVKKTELELADHHEENETEVIQRDVVHYQFPSIELLNPPIIVEGNDEWLYEQKELLNTTLQNFNVGAQVVNVTQGPAVTRFEVQPEPGVKVNKITNLSDDIKLSLAARDIRIEAPIPGKHTIGIEVPNQKSRPVFLSEIINTHEFMGEESPLTSVLGLDISGRPIVTDLRKMPHGLIAGATGSGKSVCINTILVSLLYKARPEELKLLLIDPKMVELAPYNHIPHLVSPVITDVKAATAALKWAVEEMERRYELFAHIGVRDISRFNELAEENQQYSDKLPYIVIVIDELADLMMMSPADVEEAVSRIAQKARACGIHLIIATQRPSVDVITGLIKANIPTRIAFSVSSQVDSRTIIDISGAEKLLGRGDMLFLENGSSKPVRLQGTFVSDEEIDRVVAHAREQGKPKYLFQQEELLKKAQVDEEDELFYEACEFVIEHGGASTSLLQRRFKIGYNRAARLIDMMEQHGYISESRGSKPRDVFITDAELSTLH